MVAVWDVWLLFGVSVGFVVVGAVWGAVRRRSLWAGPRRVFVVGILWAGPRRVMKWRGLWAGPRRVVTEK